MPLGCVLAVRLMVGCYVWHVKEVVSASAGTYLIVRDLAEAQYVVDYILHGGDRDEFLAKFAKAMSKVRLFLWRRPSRMLGC